MFLLFHPPDRRRSGLALRVAAREGTMRRRGRAASYGTGNLTCKFRARGKFFVRGKKSACGRYFSYIGQEIYTVISVFRGRGSGPCRLSRGRSRIFRAKRLTGRGPVGLGPHGREGAAAWRGRGRSGRGRR